MHAIAHRVKQHDAGRRVVYLSAEKFMYQFVRALRSKDTMTFKELFRSVDLLMVDDVQFISGKDSTQEEFFHTFNTLVDRGPADRHLGRPQPLGPVGAGGADPVAAGLGAGRRYPPHHLRAAPGHPAGQGRAAAASTSRSGWWSSWPAASPATCASWRVR